MSRRAAEVTVWLRSLMAGIEARPVRVAVSGEEPRDAAAYLDAVSGQERLYVLGETPRSYRGSSRTCYRIGDRDWYVACYHTGNPPYGLTGDPPPFGAFFILCLWEVPGGEAIDVHEARPYRRIATMIEEVSP